MMFKPKTIRFFLREDNKLALEWRVKIRDFLDKHYFDIQEVEGKADILFALGGDGTIIEAARRFHEQHMIIFGLNLGTVGFLASIRDPKDFFQGINRLLNGDYKTHERMMLGAEVHRKGKSVFKASAMNDFVIQNLLGLVELKVSIAGHSFQTIRGGGVLISTATGSTAFNLSAHGPVLMPNIKGMIITELLDHNIPTPSLVIKHDQTITVKVESFRQRGILSLTESGKPVDVLLLADAETAFPLEKEDEIHICKSPYLITFAEIEDNYFFKSLAQKFAFG